MKDASRKILTTLQERGYRVTNARIQVVDALANAKSPLSIQMLAKRVAVDEASVYRTIALLCREGFAEEINTQSGASRYSLSHGHHHHIVCTGCEFVVHVPCDREPRTPSHVEEFVEIRSHELTYYGLCKKCA